MASAGGVGLTMELSKGFTAGRIATMWKNTDAACYEAIQRATVRAAARMLDEMTVRCPVDTGFMRDHIRVRLFQNDLMFEAGWDVMDFVEAGFAFYPYFQEFGTVKMAAQPTLGPATRVVMPEYRADVRVEVQAAMSRLTRLAA